MGRLVALQSDYLASLVLHIHVAAAVAVDTAEYDHDPDHDRIHYSQDSYFEAPIQTEVAVSDNSREWEKSDW